LFDHLTGIYRSPSEKFQRLSEKEEELTQFPYENILSQFEQSKGIFSKEKIKDYSIKNSKRFF